MSSPYWPVPSRNSTYIPTPPPARRPVPRPPARRPITAATAPIPPNFRALLEQLLADTPDRSEADWKTTLDARTQPFIDTINQSTDQARAMNEYRYETKSAANQGLSSAFLGMLTGGRTGADAEQYSKDNFGGSYLGAQAMSMAADRLTELTADFDEGDFRISGQYLELMREVPAIREELRATLEKQDMDDHTRKVTEATLLMDETWRYYDHQQAGYQFGVGAAETKRVNTEQIEMARSRLGLDAADDLADTAAAAKTAALRQAELGLKAAREARQGLKDQASIRQADARIRISRENLKLQQQKFRQDKATGGVKASAAKKAETDLAISILEDRDRYLGKSGTRKRDSLLEEQGEHPDGMGYQEAYRQIRALAEETMGFRSPAYINTWVRKQLARLGLKDPAARPRQGR